MLKPTDKKPYECPKCDGTGESPMPIGIVPFMCMRCNGTGVIWATDKEAAKGE